MYLDIHLRLVKGAFQNLANKKLAPFSKDCIKIIQRANIESDIFRRGKEMQHVNEGDIGIGLKFAEELKKTIVNGLVNLSKIKGSSKAASQTKEKIITENVLYPFGALTHLVEDYYAHTNLVHLLKPPKRPIWNESLTNPNVTRPDALKCCRKSDFASEIRGLIPGELLKNKLKDSYEKLYLKPGEIYHSELGIDTKGNIASVLFKDRHRVSGIYAACRLAMRHTQSKWKEITESLKQKIGSADSEKTLELLKKFKSSNPFKTEKYFMNSRKDIDKIIKKLQQEKNSL